MPHAFSVEIHNYITDKIQLMEGEKIKAVQENNRKERLYCEGQLFELFAMRKYLTTNIDLKNQSYF